LTGVGQGLAHAGEMVKDIGKVQEFQTRQQIENSPGLEGENEIKLAEKARDQATAAYENFYNQTIGDKELQTSINAPNAGIELLQPGVDKKTLPTDLRTVPQIAGQLSQAKLDTKINSVLLTAEVDRQAKALRARFPDHVDYIDHEFARAGFGNTANAKMQALQQYFLSANAGKDEDLKNSISYAHSHSDVPGIDTLVDRLHAGDRTAIPVLERAVRRYESAKDGLKLSVEQLDASNKFTKDAAGKSWADYTSNVVNGGFQTMYDKAGYKNLEQINARVQEIQAGGAAATNPLEVEKLKQTLHLLRDQQEAAMEKELFRPLEKNSGKTTATLLGAGGEDGAAKGRAQIQTALGAVDRVIQAVENKDFGLASYIPAQHNAMVQAATKSMLDDKDLGPHMINLGAAAKISPEWGQKLYEANHPDVSEALQAWDKNREVGMVTKGTPANDAAKVLIDYGKNPQAARSLVEKVDLISKPAKDGGLRDDNQKRNVAKSFFDAANQGFLKNFPNDSYERDRNGVLQYKPGRMAIFKRMTKDANADEMKRLGPETWNMYKTYVEHEHGDILFTGQLKQLDQFTENKYFKDLDFGWDDKEGHFHVKPKAGTTTFKDVPPAVKRVIDQVNTGLDSLNYIAKKDGHSSTVYTLQKLRELNFNFEGFSGIPAEMLGAVEKSTSAKPVTLQPGEDIAAAKARIKKAYEEGK
jgi:hypothetical protein